MTYAFFNTEATKASWLASFAQSKADGKLLSRCGYWWLIGECPWVGSEMSAREKMPWTDAGIPDTLCRLQYSIFERLAVDRALEWPERFFSAIHVGADLSKVCHQFLAWLLDNPDQGVAMMAAQDGYEMERDLVLEVAQLFRQEETDLAKWRAVERLLNERSLKLQKSENGLLRILNILPTTHKVVPAIQSASCAVGILQNPRQIRYVIENAGHAACTSGGRRWCFQTGLYPDYHQMMAEQLLVLLGNAPVPTNQGLGGESAVSDAP